MNSKTVVSAIVAASLATGGFAFAEGRGTGDDHDDRGRNEQAQRGGHKDRHDGGRQHGHDDRSRAHNDQRRDERGAGPNHNFHKGGRLPVEYRQRYYVVDNWRGHHLRAPPRGYHWVQTGADYVLVAIATGVILQILLYSD